MRATLELGDNVSRHPALSTGLTQLWARGSPGGSWSRTDVEADTVFRPALCHRHCARGVSGERADIPAPQQRRDYKLLVLDENGCWRRLGAVIERRQDNRPGLGVRLVSKW